MIPMAALTVATGHADSADGAGPGGPSPDRSADRWPRAGPALAPGRTGPCCGPVPVPREPGRTRPQTGCPASQDSIWPSRGGAPGGSRRRGRRQVVRPMPRASAAGSTGRARPHGPAATAPRPRAGGRVHGQCRTRRRGCHRCAGPTQRCARSGPAAAVPEVHRTGPRPAGPAPDDCQLILSASGVGNHCRAWPPAQSRNRRWLAGSSCTAIQVALWGRSAYPWTVGG